ncbi:MAG: adenosylcobinamide-GDP ribazoletransferase [Rhodospirillaceae bacterium]|nr:adenosylcobinamide-GDP ribazoletransferase [Rhodospirillaceae bacterium]
MKPGPVGALAHAAAFLTRLPVPAGLAHGPLAPAMAAFPVVGAALGLAAGLVYGLASWLGLGPWPASLLAVATPILLTGALHEDGLADTADGLGGGHTAERRLEIMRDSRTGAFGVLALILSVALRAGALAAIAPGGAAIGVLIAAGAWSRALLPAVPRILPAARDNGLGAGAGKPDDRTTAIALGLGAAALLFGLGFGGSLIALAVSAAATWLLLGAARRTVGGHTGDIMGAAQQIAEMAVLLTAAAWIGG